MNFILKKVAGFWVLGLDYHEHQGPGNIFRSRQAPLSELTPKGPKDKAHSSATSASCHS